MPTRRETSAAKRNALYRQRMDAEPDELRRLWIAIAWLIAETVRAGRIADLHTTVLDLVKRVRESLPLPDAYQQPATQPPAGQPVHMLGLPGRSGNSSALPTEGAPPTRREQVA